jgi:hypothetical protein
MRHKGMANTATRKTRFAFAFAASALALATLAACHGTNGDGYSGGGNTGGGITGTDGGGVSGTSGGGVSGTSGGGVSGTSGGGVSGTSGGGVSGTSGGGSGSVTGTVTWHDGQPAANASVYFFNYDPGFSASGWYDGESGVQQLPADGSYSLTGCPCQDLTAYLYIPAPPGGQACWIIMQDDNQTYSGRLANPGDVINWQALDLPCSPTWYTSDQSTVQSEASTVLPELNSGSWQSWEASTSGS